MAEGAVPSEPFSAASREIIREMSPSSQASLATNLSPVRISDRLSLLSGGAIRELSGKVLPPRCECCKETAALRYSLIGHQGAVFQFLMVGEGNPEELTCPDPHELREGCILLSGWELNQKFKSTCD